MTAKRKSIFTAHPSSDREKKNLLFLNLIKDHKSTSRTEISKLTDINIVTVSNYINSYLKKALVLERGYDISSGGRRPELIELNREWGCVIGIDIGKGCIRGVLADLNMEVLVSEAIDNYEEDNLKSFISEIVKKVLSASKKEMTQAKKIGIGVSAISEKAREKVIREKDNIEKEFGIPTLIASAALCAAFGEKNSNPEARDSSSILCVYSDLGEGVIVKDGEFYETTDKKVEYTYLRPWGPGLGVISEAKRIAERGIGTNIVDIAEGNIENITLDTIVKAAEKKDEVGIDLIKIAGMNLGVRVAYLINSFEPEIVIIGGGIEEAGDLFLEPLTSSVNRFISQKMADKVKLAPAVLGKEACVKGGAFLAVREAFIEA